MKSFCQWTACPSNKYRCTMGLCVPASTWCDGYLDCPDGSDELPTCNGSTLYRLSRVLYSVSRINAAQ